jgi:hypothetical protein
MRDEVRGSSYSSDSVYDVQNRAPNRATPSVRGEDRLIDPAMKMWSARVRINNFTAIESSPLCVSIVVISYTEEHGAIRLTRH